MTDRSVSGHDSGLTISYHSRRSWCCLPYKFTRIHAASQPPPRVRSHPDSGCPSGERRKQAVACCSGRAEAPFMVCSRGAWQEVELAPHAPGVYAGPRYMQPRRLARGGARPPCAGRLRGAAVVVLRHERHLRDGDGLLLLAQGDVELSADLSARRGREGGRQLRLRLLARVEARGRGGGAQRDGARVDGRGRTLLYPGLT